MAGDEVAEYVAPARAPAGNPVAVSVQVTYSDNSTAMLVSNIKVRNSCEPNVRAVAALRDPCGAPNLFGTSKSTITDATPLFRIEAEIEWVYDSLHSVPGLVVSFYPRGTAHFISLDPCTQISPDTYTWDLTYPYSTGSITVSTIGSDSSWTGFAGVLWTATYSDPCDPNDTPAEGAVGGGYFAANGQFDGSYAFQGTQTIGGQTFQYSFAPASANALKALTRRK